MNFDLTDEQEMVRDTFARFLDENSSSVRIRAAMPSGFDADLWQGLAELGAFAMRVPEEAGGMGMGLFEAAILMEEAGRTLASGPLAEALVAARLLGQLGGAEDLLGKVISGEAVATIAMRDIAEQPVQWIAGGLVADAVIARKGSDVVLVQVPASSRHAEANLASTPIAELDLGALPATVLGSGADALATFAAGLEEWKLLIGVALSGLSRQALLMAAAYAGERKAFGVFIGTFQAISHPMADLICEIDGGKFLVWKAIRAIADGDADAAALVSMAGWWNAETAARTVTQSLHSFGGIGLTLEHDIHLYNLRAKAWPLMLGDPQELLAEAGRRLYAGETASLPDVGDVPVEFDLGDEARLVQQEIRDFFAANVTDEQREKFHYSWEGHNSDIHQALVKANLAYLQLPKDVGGRGLNAYAVTGARDAFEDEGWNNPVAGVAQMVALIMHRFGSDELKRDVLSKVMSGEAICSLGYSEPGCGSDVFAAQCKATQLEDGSWRIDGTKMWTSGANLTDYVLMLTRTDPDAPKHKGLTMFIVPLKAEGVTVQGVHTFMDERTNITFYDGVKIPDSWRLGEINGGGRTMAASLELEHGGGFAKVQRAMLEEAVELCREIPAAGGKLIDTPRAQMRLARTHANYLASELIAYRANWAQVEGKGNGAYGPMAKMFSSEKFTTDSRDLLDLTAPYSLSKRKGPAKAINQAYRHAHGTTIYGGTSEVHRSMIAEKGLGLPAHAVDEDSGMTDEAPHLLTEETGDGILIATLNRPDKLNAISREMMDLLTEAVERLRDTPELKVMLIRSTGRYFSSGADLRGGSQRIVTPVGNTPRGIRENHRLNLNNMQQLWDEMEHIEKPIVAAHHAMCVGGGLEMSLSCDFRFAAKSAGYAFPEGLFGVLPASNGVSRLTRICGPHWARWLIMANKPAPADMAFTMGLVHQVFPDETFEAEVMEFCRHLTNQNGEQMGAAKVAIEMCAEVSRDTARHVERMANSALMLNPDYIKGMEAYLKGVGGKGKKG